jgi:hypothetical protein
MKTSRAQLDRLLDPDNEFVTLATLTRAAQARRAAVADGIGLILFGVASPPWRAGCLLKWLRQARIGCLAT